MSTVPTNLPSASADFTVTYPTSDGRPMGETDLHREIMFELIETLKEFYRGRQVYVSGKILLYYEEGNKRRHVSPDVLITKGLEMRLREYYLLWVEGLPPSMVIEVTSASTRKEDLRDKMNLYRDVIKVNEYFLFDPRSEYLKPPLQGYRLVQGEYVPIEPVDGRLPSQEMGLHLEWAGQHLRLYNPATRRWIPTFAEMRQEIEAEVARLRAELAEKERDKPGGTA
ncbi:MAG TPA: Uma2 family endonuclease [Pirellulaceae bacterium]|nr:Uma2 family endonuclease [Pirellulaceae bacterium]